jgi:hypothetical protein
MSSLVRFWFEFERSSTPTILNIGCGVTAHDYDDALSLLRERVFMGREIPTITRLVENVDTSTLDERHVLPNLGIASSRGVWFPKL